MRRAVRYSTANSPMTSCKRGALMERGGNFSHPVKFRNFVEKMASGLQPSDEKPGKALISQAL
jgi:hypothetical protein